MSTIAIPKVDPVAPSGAPKKRLTTWEAWGMALLAPYVVVFLVFVLYPVFYGLWLARHPESYVNLADDPVFATSIVNTIIFLVVAINLKMAAALFCLGFSSTLARGSSGCRSSSSCGPLSILTILSIRFMLNPEWVW
jgi:multiple sugar transport system permease protein